MLNTEILFSIAHEQYWYLSTTLINLSCLHWNFSPSGPKTDCFSQPHNVFLSPTQVFLSSCGPTEGGSCPSPATTQQACSYSLLTNLVKQVSYRDLAPVERHKQESQQLSFHNWTVMLQPCKRHWRACSAETGRSKLQLLPLLTAVFQLTCKYLYAFHSQNILPVHAIGGRFFHLSSLIITSLFSCFPLSLMKL